ncbi:hypothetical protein METBISCDRAFT_6981, partial [Metschnikowia bicuspidata]
LLLWHLAWSAAYRLVGLYLGYVSINNGILLNNIKLRCRIELSAASVRFRLWGNTRKIIISDLTIVLPADDKMASRSPAPGLSKSTCISVYPKSCLAAAAVRLSLAVLPSIDVELRSCNINKGDVHVHISSLQFNGRVCNSPKNAYLRRLSLSAHLLRTSVTLGSKPQHAFASSTLRILTSFSLDADTGTLSNGTCRLSVVESRVSSFDFLQRRQPATVPRGRRGTHPRDKIAYWHDLLLHTFDAISVNVANLQVHELPMLPASPNVTLRDIAAQQSAQISVSVTVKSLDAHWTKIRSATAGFEVLFDAGDEFPFALTLSSLVVEFSFVAVDAATGTAETKEFLTIPNFSTSFKTNIPGHLIQGSGLQNGAFELFCSCSSPNLDLDVEQLALVSFNYVAAKKLLQLRRLSKQTRREDASASDDDDTTRTEKDRGGVRYAHKDAHAMSGRFDKLLDDAYDLLDDYYPRVDFKLTIEQARALISSSGPACVKRHFLLLLYSMMIFQVLTISPQEYDAKWHVLHPRITLTQNLAGQNSAVTSQDFCGLTEAKLTCRMMQSLRLKSALELHGAYLNLTRPQTLDAFSHLVNETTQCFTSLTRYSEINKQLHAELYKARGHLHRRQIAGETLPFDWLRLFCPLPSCLAGMTVKLTEITVWLGSTSPFLQALDLAEFLHASGDACETPNKTHFHVSSVVLALDSSEVENTEATSSVTTSSLKTLIADETLVFWRASLAVRDLRLLVIDDVRLKTSLIVDMPAFDAVARAAVHDSQPLVFVDAEAAELKVAVDRHKVYAFFGLVHLIRHTIVKPLRRLARKFAGIGQPLFGQAPGRIAPLAHYVRTTFFCRKVIAVAGLFDDFKVRVQVFGVTVGQSDRMWTTQVDLFRGLISSAVQPGYWDRVLYVDTLTCRVNYASDKEFCVIEVPCIRLVQPHGLVVYKLFDSIVVFVKILKHLVRALCEKEHGVVIQSKESRPLEVPAIKLRSGRITFVMEDDPFEAELGMVYQLGLVEQKKRLELHALHEKTLSSFHGYEDSASERLEALHRLEASLWIRKVKAYRAQLLQEIEANSAFLFQNEPQLTPDKNLRVWPYQRHAPLLHVVLSGVDLNISAPRFAQKNFAQFVHDHGQGVPKTMRYSLMLPTYVQLAVEELRIHLRDYPLPLLYLPHTIDATGKGRALLMQGNLVISEAMAAHDHSLRRLHVRLAEGPRRPDALDSVVLLKSLAPVKLYTDMEFFFDLEKPSRFVWGQLYQFGIQQVMLKFDQFSKPPVDPSPMLGFWDKLRLIIHGHVTVRTGKRACLEVAFKGGRDPYSLFTDSTGFILRFKDSVVCKINENDDPLEFFDVSAQKVSWYIPNYLASPLVCWCRESDRFSYLPASREMITSCYAYYLQRDAVSPDADFRQDVCEKNVVVLSGGVNLKVGFLLQRPGAARAVTSDSTAHYDVSLHDPLTTRPGHDSYRGFRLTRIHMALSLVAHTEASHNTIHLTPGTFRHFFAWWHLFAGNTILPVRRGRLFGEEQDKTKFSEHLYTNKFLFRFKNLFIGHVHRSDGDVGTDGELECVGLRAKVDNFVVDLHQRKEQVIDESKDFSRRNKIMKMLFNVGGAVLSKIDLRTVHAVFNRAVYVPGKNAGRNTQGTLHVFDKDRRWYDHRDYLEAFEPADGTYLKTVEIQPLLFSDKFSYIRESIDGKDDYDWGTEETHRCMLHLIDIYTTQIKAYTRMEELKCIHARSGKRSTRKLKASLACLSRPISECKLQRKKSIHRDSVTSVEFAREKFHNRFVLISMFLKWNEDVRNPFMKYLHFVQMHSRLKTYLSYGFISMLDGMIDANDLDEFSLPSSRMHGASGVARLVETFAKSKDRLENFDEIMREVRDREKVLENCSIEIVSPQIQLHTKEVVDSVLLITAPVLESKIFSVVMDKDSPSNANALETRYGVFLHDASVLVFEKNQAGDSLSFEEKPYGTTSSWPPFLGIETCKSMKTSLQEQTLIEQMSLMVTYEEVFALGKNIEMEMETPGEGDGASSGNRLRVEVPELIIRSTSKQYFTLYVTVLSLILYMEPLMAEIREKMSRLKFSIDFEDLHPVNKRLKALHEYLAITKTLLNNYSFRHDGCLDKAGFKNYLHLMDQKAALSSELMLTLQTLFTGDVFKSSSKDVENWCIATDKITLHMLQDDRKPILDLVMEQGRYKCVVKDDGSNDNNIEIANIRGVTLLEDAYYTTFLELLTLPRDSLVIVNWSMSRAIGGIKLMDYFEIKSLPLNVRIDEATGRLLMKFVFDTDDGELNDSPILRIADQSDIENIGHDAFDDETASRGSSKDDLLWRTGSTVTRRSRKSGQSTPSFSSPLKKQTEFDEDVEVMLGRSKKYISIVKMVSRAFEILISLCMKSGVKKWLNVTDFFLELPEWEIENKVISLLDVANMFKKLVIKTLVQHSGKLLRNKMS